MDGCLPSGNTHVTITKVKKEALRGAQQSQSRPQWTNTKFKLCVSFLDLHKASSVVSDSVRPHGLQAARLLCPWDSGGKNTGEGCHALLRGISPTQGLNPCLLRLFHWQTPVTSATQEAISTYPYSINVCSKWINHRHQ